VLPTTEVPVMIKNGIEVGGEIRAQRDFQPPRRVELNLMLVFFCLSHAELERRGLDRRKPGLMGY